jgi:alcohol dehydrogenase (NADP+)
VLSLLTLTTLLSVSHLQHSDLVYADSSADGVMAQGGYSTTIRTNDRFVFAIPEELASEDAAPMLCAGLTVYSPMVRNNVGPGKKIGIVGIGGLGRESISPSHLSQG